MNLYVSSRIKLSVAMAKTPMKPTSTAWEHWWSCWLTILKCINPWNNPSMKFMTKILPIMKVKRKSLLWIKPSKIHLKIASMWAPKSHKKSRPSKNKYFSTLTVNHFLISVDNLKISNPNISQKPKPHDKYMNKSTNEKDENEEILEDLLRKNREL